MTRPAVNTPPVPRQAAQPPAGAPTPRQIAVILSGLMMGMFLAALDQTIVSTAIRTIADDLKGLDLQAWATTAYLITATVSTPIYGKLSDIYGRRPLFMAAISIFVIGSAACTFSQSMYELAIFRAVQGLGAGGLMSLVFTIIADLVPPRERAKYQGYFLAVFGVSTVLGPVLGGFLAGQSSILGIDGWRWVFLVNVPIGAAALGVVARVLHLPHQRHEQRIDWFGALSLSVGLVPLLIVAEQGRSWGWTSNRAVLCYAASAIGLITFVFVEHLMKDEAMIPLRLFRINTFTMSIVVSMVIGVGMFGGISLVPQYLQIVQRMSPTKAGLMLLPMMLGIMAGSIISGQITSKTGRYKVFPIIGSALLVGGLLLFHGVGVTTPLWQLVLYMAVFGLGLGNCLQTLTVAAQNAVPVRDIGVATAAATFFRQMGGTVGVAVFLSILFSTVGEKISAAFVRIGPTAGFQAALHDPAVLQNPADRQVVAAIQSGGTGGNVGGVLQDSSFLQRIDARLARPFLEGFSQSVDLVFLVGACVLVVAFLLAWFIREVPLRAYSGNQTALMEGAEAMGSMPTEPDPAQREPSLSQRVAAEPPPMEPILREHTLRESGPDSAPRQNVAADSRSAGVDLFRPAEPVLAGVSQHPPARPNGRSDMVVAAQAAGSGGGVGATGSGGGVGVGAAGSGGGVAATGSGGGAAASDGGLAVRGAVRRAGGGTVGGATLTLIDHGGRQVGRGSAGGDGGFTLSAPSTGSYVLVTSAPGYQPWAGSVVVGSGPANVDVVLAGSSGVTGLVRVAGTDQAVAGALVTLTNAQGEVVSSVPTNAEGRYRFTELVAGAYVLVVTAGGYRPVAAPLSVADTGEVSHDVELAGGVQLSGAARTRAGQPVPDARITVLDMAGNVVAVTYTDAEGEYVLADLSAGDCTVVASGYPPVAAQSHLPAGEQVRYDVELGWDEDA
jgi:EmrB/QacA subfamily drug resistance transporter